MNTEQIANVIMKFAELSGQEYNELDIKSHFKEPLSYKATELGKYIDHLIEEGQRINLTLLKNHIPKDSLDELLKVATFPLLVFEKQGDDLYPIIIFRKKKNKLGMYCFSREIYLEEREFAKVINNLKVYESTADTTIIGEVIFITAFPMPYMLNDYYREDQKIEKFTSIQRLFRLLYGERKDIIYIYIYAVIIGLISLSLPLGTQVTISLISGGMIFSSVIVLIALVVLGVLLGGALQITQLAMVEILQQRVFSKASFEIAYRITRIKTDVLSKYFPPELMNRFFDVILIQKNLPKLLVDINGAAIQILFGLILLSLYHPFFLFFSITLVIYMTLIIYVTGPKGLETSVDESSYKYKIIYWLHELARNVQAFKHAGNTNLPLQRMDKLVNRWLFFRKAHFRILIIQFINVTVFKTLVTGGLLIIGTVLVVDRQITLGQFVASELIIVLVVGSVEKVIINLDVIYDILTGLKKVAKITDLPIESQSGLRVAFQEYEKGVHLRLKDMRFRYPGNHTDTLKGIDMEAAPGESVCIVGPNDSGKHTLMKVITGTLNGYDGIITINHYSLRDVNLVAVRDIMSKSLSFDEIFDGSILDNITLGRTDVYHKDVLWAIENIGLSDFIASLKEGLFTHIGPSGLKLSSGVQAKLLLARSVVSRPRLLVVDYFMEHISKQERLKILSFLQDKQNGWTVIFLSVVDDPTLMQACEKVFVMKEGQIVANGNYETITQSEQFRDLLVKDC